jgi:hypothetical protein
MNLDYGLANQGSSKKGVEGNTEVSTSDSGQIEEGVGDGSTR